MSDAEQEAARAADSGRFMSSGGGHMATLLVTVFVQNEKANRGKTEQAAAVWRA